MKKRRVAINSLLPSERGLKLPLATWGRPKKGVAHAKNMYFTGVPILATAGKTAFSLLEAVERQNDLPLFRKKFTARLTNSLLANGRAPLRISVRYRSSHIRKRP